MKTILIVAYHYPPENGSCSEKNVRIVKKFVEAGYRVRVITRNATEKDSLNERLSIYHTKSGRFHKDIPKIEDCTCSRAQEGHGIKSQMKAFLSAAAIPDATIDWIPEVKRYISNHSDVLKGVDLIYSISSPYSVHLLSRDISRITHIPYIMCYGDPWIYEPKRRRGIIRYRIEKMMEKALIDEAAGVSLITEWNRREYMRLYDIPEKKINTYLIGYEENNNYANSEERICPEFSLLYGGSLDLVHRNVEPFMKAMKKINGVYIEIRNNDFPQLKDLIMKYNLKGRVVAKPLIPSDEFVKLQYKFDALILFGNKTPFQIPGKVFTYISTGKTIIYIKNNTFSDDGTEDVLRKYGNAIIVNNEENAIAESINQFIHGSRMIESCNSMQFKYDITMEPLVEMVDRVINQNNR